MEASEPVRRTLEIEEATNRYFIHPVAGWLVPIFARLGIHPNTVSLAGMAFGILAALAYYRYQSPYAAITGFILMIAWHIMDGADGQLARLTKKQSATGKVLDGICDYVTFIAVYSALAIPLSRTHGNAIWLLAIAAGLCHAVQSAAYEVQRQEYSFWGLGRKSAALLELTAPPSAVRGSWLPRVLAALDRAYIRVQLRASGVTREFHERLAAAIEPSLGYDAPARRRYREIFAPLVRRWSVMSANYRTLGIFIFASAGAPDYYFWFEIIGFSAISLLLLRMRRARYRLFFRTF
jgi:phosphatidylglycerophosphate synthase